MRRPPSLPIPGQPLSVNFAREVVKEIRATRILPGSGLKLRYSPNGTSLRDESNGKSSSLPSTSSKAQPFQVRWMSHDENGDQPRKGEWQIYLPAGCASVSYVEDGLAGTAYSDTGIRSGQYETGKPRKYVAQPKNKNAKDTDGEEIFQWYNIPTPSNEDGDILQTNGLNAVSWTVWVLMKPWARYTVSTNPDEDEPAAWSLAVATIWECEYTQDEGEDGGMEASTPTVEHGVVQLHTGEWKNTWHVSGNFAIRYKLTNEKSKDSEYKVELVNQALMVGRLQLENLNPVDVSHAEHIWVKIEHSTEKFKLSVLTECNETSDDDKTVFKIYDMEDGIVTQDLRSSIPDLPFYTSAGK